jgi:hypothetical protein
VGYDEICFECELEVSGGFLVPACKQFFCGISVEGIVELHCSEYLGVEIQPASFGELLGVEFAFPVVVVKA